MSNAFPALVALFALGCAAEPKQGDGVFAVTSTNPDRPRLRYLDGQLSLNSTCMIRLGNKLNPKVPPVFVNGAPLGFC